MIQTISTQDAYEIKADLERGIVYENFKGMFTKEVIASMEKDYKTKILPHLRGKKWAKYCDMRNYKMANAKDELNAFVGDCMKNGMAHAAIIVESAVVKLTMNNVGNTVGVKPVAFTEENEAKAYLDQCGY